jgi:DNA-binding MarR family transcriptional regulator
MESTLKTTRIFANQVRDLIHQIAGSFESYERACVTYMGVTTAQGGAILSFSVNAGLTMNELSKTVNLDTSTMTRMVDQLLEKGLVYRQNDARDRRVIRVGLTDSGKKLRSRLEKALQSFYKNSLGQIQEEERGIIIRCLEHIDNAVAKGLEECCAKYCRNEKKKA